MIYQEDYDFSPLITVSNHYQPQSNEKRKVYLVPPKVFMQSGAVVLSNQLMTSVSI